MTAQPPTAALPVAPPPTSPSPRTVRWRTAALIISGVALVGLVVSVAAFATGAVAGALSAQTEAEELRAEGETLSAVNEELTARVEELEAEVHEFTEHIAEIEIEHERLVEAAWEEGREAGEASLAKVVTERDELTRMVASQKTRIGELEAQVTRASAPPAPQAPTYFQNCTAAREAGAAPVHRGDPGYGPHLDRDGDGIGCE